MARGMYSRNTASRHLRAGMLRGGSLLICCSVCLCLALRQAEAQVHPQLKAQRPSKYACPVTANLSPRQERAGSMLRFIFPEELLTSEKAARRISIALVSSNGKDVEIPFIWTDVGPYYGPLLSGRTGAPIAISWMAMQGFPETSHVWNSAWTFLQASKSRRSRSQAWEANMFPGIALCPNWEKRS
jgi:hypothetical protein